MNHSTKIIILGFAMMIFGGSLMIADAASQVDMSNTLVFLSYNLFVGFIVVIIGLFSNKSKDTKE
ncbi:MAG: hypothetical protein K0S61_3720 [Anaerocolumna sp.]|jgi:ABC-type Na+ efflux pump permease subunit|nr:hypothetical protein [Anaerocolumna sp.]